MGDYVIPFFVVPRHVPQIQSFETTSITCSGKYIIPWSIFNSFVQNGTRNFSIYPLDHICVSQGITLPREKRHESAVWNCSHRFATLKWKFWRIFGHWLLLSNWQLPLLSMTKMSTKRHFHFVEWRHVTRPIRCGPTNSRYRNVNIWYCKLLVNNLLK